QGGEGHDHAHGRDDAHGHDHGQAHGNGHDHGGGRDRLGNPQDLAAYLARLEGEDRLAWQKPDEVIRLLGVKRGDRVCDVGVGPGYFALRLARAVGSQGEVYAFDAEPRMLEVLRQRIAEQRLFHVHPILAEEGVPPRPCDLVLVVNTFHHFRDGPGYLRRLAEHLKPGGRLANVDFHKRELPVGPPQEQKVAREDFLAAARQAGLRLSAEHDVLPYQYFLIMEPEAGREAVAPSVAGNAGAPPARPPAAAPRAAVAPAPARPRKRRRQGASRTGGRREPARKPPPRATRRPAARPGASRRGRR
ncbi:MAG TPA: methyltransferase domain-containing protein, partial [Anaeromyxobacteraceae bacterium]|nr:methyltransferase domain-containing protein [Anaeromyxobacteraceae bacterium]